MDNIREMNHQEFRAYVKKVFGYEDAFLDYRIGITVVDLLRLLEVNDELMKFFNLD